MKITHPLGTVDSYTPQIRYLVMFLSLVMILAGMTCVHAREDSGKSEKAGSGEEEPRPSRLMDYRIGPSDVISMYIWDHKDMDRTVTVRPDGMISLPLLGELKAAGLTPSQLQELLVKGLKEYMDINNREVTVVVDEVHSYKVSVLGEVNSPGRFEFQSHVTVLDALARAGGLTEFASESRILLLRPDGNSTKRIHFDYNGVMKSNGRDSRLFVRPGDMILVP